MRHPGVYVQEVSSGSRTIAGVDTGVTAVVGRAPRGPVNVPTDVSSLSEFERLFGGHWSGGQLAHTVRDFFANGGRRAVIVRLFRPGDGDGIAVLDAGPVALRAASPGRWGRRLRWQLAVAPPTRAARVARQLGVDPSDVFDLTVTEMRLGGPLERRAARRERHINLTFRDTPRRIDRVLASNALVRWNGSEVHGPPSILPAFDPVSIVQRSPERSSATVQAAIDTLGGNDGQPLTAEDFLGAPDDPVAGLRPLDGDHRFDLLCIPPYSHAGVDPSVLAAAIDLCERRRAFLIMDPPPAWDSTAAAALGMASFPRTRNGAVYFPRLRASDPIHAPADGTFAPSGAVAGVIARTDAERGVWKAPAGTEATIRGITGLELALHADDSETLNPLGVNLLRTFPNTGAVVWGARTVSADPEWKYVNVRRTMLFIEESLDRGTRWAVFEPNDEPLWAELRLRIEAFLDGLFRQGALTGATQRDAYFVKCDRSTMTEAEIAGGVAVVLVGCAFIRPREFTTLQMAIRAGE